MLAGVRCGTFGFEVIFGVAESASDRAGSGLVGTTSGLPMATEAGLVVPDLALTGIGAVTTSAVNSISGRETTSGRDSGSGLSAEPRHSRTCDRSAMELVVSARLHVVGRTCRYWGWLQLSGRRYGNRLVNGLFATIYVTLGIFHYLYLRSLTNMAVLTGYGCYGTLIGT